MPGRSTPSCPCQSKTSLATARVCARLSVRPNSSSTASRISRWTIAGGFGELGEIGRELVGQRVQRRRVLLHLGGGAGERLRDAWPDRRLERGQRGSAQPDPRVPLGPVHGVVPRVQALVGAGLDGRRTAQLEERAQPGRRGAAHAGDRVGAGSAAEPQQDGLRLVVERVAEQDPGRTRLRHRVPQSRVPGCAGGRLRSAVARDRDPAHQHGVEPERRRGRRGPRRHLGGAGLHAVVDDDRPDAPACPCALERRGRREREGVGAAGQRDERAGVVEVREHVPDRAAGQGDGRRQAWPIGHSLTLWPLSHHERT
jgi:hypothetical protein